MATTPSGFRNRMVSGPINITETQTDTLGNSLPQGLDSHDVAPNNRSQLLNNFDEPRIEEFDPILSG